MTVETDLHRYSVNVRKFGEKRIREALLDFTAKVIKATPRDTGRLAGNWQSSINQPILTQIAEIRPEGDTIDESANVTKKIKLGDFFFFTNNLPYARRIEEGYSQQMPQGMLRVNIKNLVNTLK
jgi:hypothetical protein